MYRHLQFTLTVGDLTAFSDHLCSPCHALLDALLLSICRPILVLSLICTTLIACIIVKYAGTADFGPIPFPFIDCTRSNIIQSLQSFGTSDYPE